LRAVIFANGDLPNPGDIPALLQPGDLILAADGGGKHCLALDINPAAVIGDFDSLSPQDLDELASRGAEIIRRPARKDETDLELALLYALERRAGEALVLAALGARWDQSLANLLLPAHPDLEDLDITFAHGPQRIFTISSKQTISGHPGDTLSLIPVGGHARGVTTSGLEYPLNDEILYLGATRGVSNVFSTAQAAVTVEEGLLICVHIPTSNGESS
jgi:thiamine pyrophosphokinase